MKTPARNRFQTGYRVMLLHPDTRWHHAPSGLLARWYFGAEAPAIAAFAGRRIRIARGFVCHDALGARYVERLKGDILRFDEEGYFIRADLGFKMRVVSGRLSELSQARGQITGATDTVVEASARFRLAGLTWMIDEPLSAMLCAMMLGDFPAPVFSQARPAAPGIRRDSLRGSE